MANTITIQSMPYDGRYLKLDCTQTIDISGNYSTINWTLSSVGGNSNNYSTGPTTVNIDGVEVVNIPRTAHTTKQFPAAKGSTSGSLKVYHNNDGTKRIGVTLSTAIYHATVTPINTPWTLDTIPRAATITGVSAFTDENNPTITYTNYAGSSASRLGVYIYDNSGTTLLADCGTVSTTGTSGTITLQEHHRTRLRELASDTNALPVKFYLKTTIGDNTYWSAPYNATMNIVNANPIASINYWDGNEKSTMLTGDSRIFMRGVSDFQYTIDAQAQKGAAVYGYGVYLGSKSASGETNTIHDIDGEKFTLVVTDTRGNEYRETFGLVVIPYIPLTCSQEVSIELDGETGAKITCNITGNYYDGAIGATQNSLNLYYRVAEGSAEPGNWIYIGTAQTISNGKYTCKHTFNSLNGQPLNYEKSYTIEISAQDAYTSVGSGGRTVRLTPVFDWSDTDFNFNVPLKYKGKDMPVIIAQGTKDGWYYRNWSNGMGEAWKILTHTTALNTAWGSLYTGTSTARQNYPFPFKSKPVEIVNCTNGNYAAWICAESGDLGGTNGGYASACYKIVRPTAATTTSTFYISFYVYGEV